MAELTEYGKLLESFKKREADTLLSQKTRRAQVESIYSDIIKRYEPGGAFGTGYESLIQRQKVRDVGASTQRDISRGLYGIRPYEQEWEATTGASARLKLEDLRMERLSGAQTGMAGFLERIDEPYPDYSSLMQASQAQGQSVGYAPTGPRQNVTADLAAARASNPYMRSLLDGGGGGGGGTAPATSTGGGGIGVYGGGDRSAEGTGTGGLVKPVAESAGQTRYSTQGMLGSGDKLNTWDAVKKKHPSAVQIGKSSGGQIIWGANPYTR